MSKKHLRGNMLSAVNSPEAFKAFCIDFGTDRRNSSKSDHESFAQMFRLKAHQYGDGMDSKTVEAHIAAMSCEYHSEDISVGGVDGSRIEGAVAPRNA